MSNVNVNGLDMYYEVHGKGEPLVLVSGFSVDHTGWQTVVDKFSTQYQVLVFDNRGAGQTTVPTEEYSIEQLADDTAALCQALDIKQAHFIGNSMGGCIVQMLAYRHPAMVQSLIIENSVAAMQCGFGYYLDAQLAMIQAGVDAETILRAALAWCYSYRHLSQPGMLEQMIEEKLVNPHPFTADGYIGQLAALQGFDSRAWLGELDVPALVVGSDLDLIFPEPMMRALAAAIPGARYESFQNCGHCPHIEYPDEFVQLVSAFLQ